MPELIWPLVVIRSKIYCHIAPRIYCGYVVDFREVSEYLLHRLFEEKVLKTVKTLRSSSSEECFYEVVPNVCVGSVFGVVCIFVDEV